MKKLVKKLSILTASLALASCSLFPSSYSPIRYKNVEVKGEVLDVDKAVDAYLITPQLLKELAPFKASAQNNPALDQQIKAYQYHVGIGDVLNVTVWDHPELTTPAGTYRSAADSGNQVHANGTIFYPYVGTIKVNGLTVNQIRDRITSRLADYIMEPQVEVTVASFQSKKAYVTGEVKNPGQQFISNVPLTLLDAINKAGGLSADADWNNVTITHRGQDEIVSVEALLQKGDLTQNRLLTDGDIIHIPRNDAQKVFVIGEVQAPQLLKIGRNGMSLTEAISASGGIDKLAADATGIFVIRGERGAKHMVDDNNGNQIEKVANIYQLDVTNPTSYILGTEFFLKPYDVVYVTTAPLTRWNRVITQVLPTITGFNDLTEGTLRIKNW
ncbi:polysaccharide export protein [Actinobacillus equuli subsp. haemolyticus]|uniref:polysaccharide export protein n=1 Tax=Actinobacillus equuli TaxID=718 RepID=UPI0024465EDF|nr:polysaccharide export protein [Actinobacillus equuli]WGE50840.1 polysaccharide export protein [Actinobacillus equuli subsp. haemolyticus]